MGTKFTNSRKHKIKDKSKNNKKYSSLGAHDRQIDFMIPGIQPTGKYVELPHIDVMKFNGNKIAHEHIYWDQASLLAQIGILGANKLPVADIEQSKRLRVSSERT
ncbi:MAG TPA: hypothetical protein VFI70_06150 [Nitrososphaeraceae archaeon]|nr:hypothetical protein [Nitrososphaeraceae archaeon]